MQINRLFEIVYVILQQKTVTAKELSERFNVSSRTIYRDIDTLSLAGIPVYTEKGKGGGIRLLPDFVLDKSIFSDREQNEILSALYGLSSLKVNETDKVLKKLSAAFNKSVTNWLEVDFSDWGYTNSYYFYDFKTAILERKIAEFDYYSSNGEKSHRRIEPIQLWFKSKAWYIKGFCLTRQDIRLFKLTRVTDLMITDEHFSERNLLAVPPSNNSAEQQQDIAFKLRIEPQMTYRVFDEFDENMIEKQPDDSFIISLTWPEDEWVYGYICSFAEYIEVIEPEHIREIIKNKALKTVNKYL